MDRTKSQQLLAALPTKRTCDGCDLCCTAMAVHSLNKPPGERCRHLCGAPGKSCSIYADRPDDCAEFICLWRGSDHHLPDGLFPAKAGFVAALGDIEQVPPVLTIHPDPDRPQAWVDHLDTLKALAAKFNCIVVVGSGAKACLALAPNGNSYSRVLFPILFKNGGDLVGLPSADFLPGVRSWLSMSVALWGVGN